MRILHVSPFYYPSIGGLERFCEELAIMTKQQGNEVHIITQTAKGERDNDERRGIRIHRIKPLLRYSKALVTPNIQEKIKEIDPDAIHIQGPAPGMADFVGKNDRIRIIMTCHNDLSLDNTTTYRVTSAVYRKFAFPRVISKLDRLVLLSDACRSHSKLFRNIPSRKIAIIPNAVDLIKFSPGLRTKADYKKHLNVDTKFLALFVGSMEPLHAYKGVEDLIHAISHIKNFDMTFICIGEGELKQRYTSLANSLQIMDRVRFPGKVDDDMLVNYYRAADIFILPSTSVEFMPLVLIEAMACATPVITTRIPGPMDMIKEGYNGYLTSPRNPRELSRTIERILSDEVKLVQMQINARREAEEKYSWDKVLEEYMKEYEGNATRGLIGY